MNSHHIHEARSLAMHRLISRQLAGSPAKVRKFALENLERWRCQGVNCEDFDVWEKLLLENSERIQDILEGDSEEAVRLRQSSPFAGLLSQEERLQILRSIV